MATTTYAAIRDSMIINVRAIVPANLADKPFDRCPVRVRLADWATKQTPGSAAFRKVEIRRNMEEEASFFSPDEIERRETAVLRVAYPVLPELYGADELDDIEEIIRRDARDLRDVIASPDNYVSGQNAAFVDELEPVDESYEHVWFLGLRIRLYYYETQNL